MLSFLDMFNGSFCERILRLQMNGQHFLEGLIDVGRTMVKADFGIGADLVEFEGLNLADSIGGEVLGGLIDRVNTLASSRHNVHSRRYLPSVDHEEHIVSLQ
jgi:hypothetical protein